MFRAFPVARRRILAPYLADRLDAARLAETQIHQRDIREMPLELDDRFLSGGGRRHGVDEPGPLDGFALDWRRSMSSHSRSSLVARVVVDVMPKPEILDPQGKAVHGALPRLGFEGVTDVRQGKRFELEIEGELTDDRLAQVREIAATLLSNPVIEDFAVRVDDSVTP